MAERMWTAAEVATLIEHYPGAGARAVAAMLDRSADSVGGLARRLGLKASAAGKHQRASRVRTPAAAESVAVERTGRRGPSRYSA